MLIFNPTPFLLANGKLEIKCPYGKRIRAALLAPTSSEMNDPNIAVAMIEVGGTPVATLLVSDRLETLRKRKV